MGDEEELWVSSYILRVQSHLNKGKLRPLI